MEGVSEERSIFLCILREERGFFMRYDINEVTLGGRATSDANVKYDENKKVTAVFITLADNSRDYFDKSTNKMVKRPNFLWLIARNYVAAGLADVKTGDYLMVTGKVVVEKRVMEGEKKDIQYIELNWHGPIIPKSMYKSNHNDAVAETLLSEEEVAVIAQHEASEPVKDVNDPFVNSQPYNGETPHDAAPVKKSLGIKNQETNGNSEQGLLLVSKLVEAGLMANQAGMVANVVFNSADPMTTLIDSLVRLDYDVTESTSFSHNFFGGKKLTSSFVESEMSADEDSAVKAMLNEV